ncbi:MAG: hypothetical protein RJA63_561 [Pseudomonadota bacterium]|jgi:integrase
MPPKRIIVGGISGGFEMPPEIDAPNKGRVMPLTDLQAKKAAPKDKPYRLADSAGMYLEVQPNGRKYWRLKYRIAGKEKRLALGVYPEVPLSQARGARDEARRLIAKGIDPSAERQAAKKAALASIENTFEAVARRWFAEHEPTWSKAYSSRIMARLEADVFPNIGAIDISALAPAQLKRMTEKIRARGVTETARRALQDVGQVLTYADLPDVTVSQRKKLPAHKVKHMAAVTEPMDAAILLRAIDGYQGGIVVRCALRLAPLVFVRPGELRAAKWADMDMRAAEWRYRVSKTDTDHIVPLAPQALAILRELEPITGHSEYVFPSPRGGRPISENALRVALIALGFGETQTAHGFRAMARTILDEKLKYELHIIEQQLAHAVRDPLGRAYNRTAHLPQRRKMMRAWAKYLDKLKARAGVVPLSGNKA